jgi:predicted 3-demethylubiquinone-9 3-methyltransferase (glyoxalase superfamily)
MARVQKITPCLWFGDGRAEEAAELYTKIFPDSKILRMSRYGESGKETHGQKPGSVMTVEFSLAGQTFTALNGGAPFKFSEAVSFQVECETQGEVDHFWSRLSDGGDPNAQQCGWLKDRYGLSWQIVPRVLAELMTDANAEAAARTMRAMLGMKKLDIAALQRAHAGRA